MNTKHTNSPWAGINRLSRDRLHILRLAFTSFNQTYAAQAAAALAYYAIFSLFPLMLFFIILGSYFLDSQRVFAQVTWSLQQVLPISQQVINENLQHVLEARGPVGVVVLVTLLWSASGAFTSLAYNIDLAWPMARRRNFFQKRLIGFRMIAGITILLVLSIVLDWIAHLAPFMAFLNTSFSQLGLLRFLSGFISWLTIFLMLLVLYRWVPATNVRWDAALWGALPASVAWKVASAAFGWYLQSGFGRYQLVYGSLGAMIALLFLIYLISFIILFGAHLTAAIDISEKQKLGIPNV
jgi:membrane protein